MKYLPSKLPALIFALLQIQTYSKNVDAASKKTRNAEALSSKPNILLIFADDVGTGDIPYYWKTSSKVSMPNLDRLSSMGVTFMDAHSTPLCAPSRYMLLSGNYAHRGMAPKGTWTLNNQDKNQFLVGQRSIADVLMNDAGYSTAMFGKWHLGGGVPMADGVDATVGVDKTSILTSTLHDWSKKIIDGPDDIGFATSFITTAGIQSSPYAFFRDGYLDIDPSDAVYWTGGDHPMPHGISKIIKGKKQGEGDKDWDSSAYNMILVNETIKFVEDHVDSKTNKPFFAYVALGAVHTPHSPPYKYLDGEDVAGVYSDSHLDMLYEMDKVVGSLVTLIEDQGLQEDTMIIFASDNGGLAGREGTPISKGHDSSGDLRGSKSSIYEGGHRIPMIIRHDGFVPQNEERSHLVGLNDLYATICDLVGVDVPSFSAQDSISFADYLASGDPMDALREELATFAFKFGTFYAQAIRFGNLKLVHNIVTSTFELYDLDSDLSETNNLIENEIYSDVVEEMYTRLLETGVCPKDKDGAFNLVANGDTVTCEWFRNWPARCGEHIEGRLNCNSICAGPAHLNECANTVFPTSVSPPLCQDSKVKFNLMGASRSCKYVGKNSSVCYERNQIRDVCPVSCNSWCTCFDTPGKFKWKGKSRSCNYVSKNKEKRCQKWIFQSHCPQVCGLC